MNDCRSPSSTDANLPAVAPARFVCPRCEYPGKAVSLLTLKHQVKLRHLTAVEDGPFAFCRTPDCPVVYFNANGMALLLDDVRQRPTAKGGANPLLCYCFGIDTAMVRNEIATTGRCAVPDLIVEEMKADRCACEIRNPQGSCCFANVTAAVRRELAAAHPASLGDRATDARNRDTQMG